jgi:hypothetical protein
MTLASLEAIAGGVTTALGFRAAGISAGIKARGGLDLALVVSDTPRQKSGANAFCHYVPRRRLGFARLGGQHHNQVEKVV